jgi:steroid delta-isomerase-like uncharacterized protein
MTRAAVEDLFARWHQCFASRDLSGLSALYAEEAVVESPTAGGTVRGRTKIEEVFRVWLAGFPDVAIALDQLVIDGDRVAGIVETHGTDTGGFLGLPPTGKPFRLPIVFLNSMRDGLIIHERRIYDFTGMLVQIGVLKVTPS